MKRNHFNLSIYDKPGNKLSKESYLDLNFKKVVNGKIKCRKSIKLDLIDSIFVAYLMPTPKKL